MYLLYIVFGKDVKYESELIYSLMSLKKVTTASNLSKITVVIYSDHTIVLPDHLHFVAIRSVIIDMETIKDWMEAANNHFLIIKPMILHKFQQEFGAPCILMDSDTFFIKDPTPLFRKVANQTFLTHLKECQFSQFYGIPDFLKNRFFTDLKGNTFSISSDFYMFNSGVIGCFPEYLPVLNEVINLICQISSSNEWPKQWSRLIEQFAFSYYLQHCNLKSSIADRTVIHYWFFKGFRHFLASKFNYFYSADKLERIEDMAKVPYSLIPVFVAELIKHHSLVPPYLLKFLPPDTLIGNLLRNEPADV